jgi:hypothetical protein
MLAKRNGGRAFPERRTGGPVPQRPSRTRSGGWQRRSLAWLATTSSGRPARAICGRRRYSGKKGSVSRTLDVSSAFRESAQKRNLRGGQPIFRLGRRLDRRDARLVLRAGLRRRPAAVGGRLLLRPGRRVGGEVKVESVADIVVPIMPGADASLRGKTRRGARSRRRGVRGLRQCGRDREAGGAEARREGEAMGEEVMTTLLKGHKLRLDSGEAAPGVRRRFVAVFRATWARIPSPRPLGDAGPLEGRRLPAGAAGRTS